MPRYGLIGDPIGHSGSPELFRKAYDGRFGYDLICGADFNTSWRRFLNDYDAVNITSPFKEVAYDAADIRSEECLLTGAANIAIKTSDGVLVHNSDYFAIRNLLSAFSDEEVFVVGFGGAGKAARQAALSLGKKVSVFNGTKREDSILPLESLVASVSGKNGILVYTLPVSIGFEPGPEHVVIESNYRNPVLSQCACRQYVPGEEWLLEQAREGYKFMTGIAPNL